MSTPSTSSPSYWGRGVGRALMVAAARTMRAQGFREATLWVLATNARTRRFYQAAGWRADGATRTELGGAEVREVRYRTAVRQDGPEGR